MMPWSYLAEFFRFRRLSRRDDGRFTVKFRDAYVQLRDDTSTTGFDQHYVYHTAWAARVLARTRPEIHVDISSSLYFTTIVSAFVPVRFYDYRPADIKLSGLESGSGNLLSLAFPDNSVRSLSCMHTIEHIGLGRYGDPLDPKGDLKAISELLRVLAKGGDLLFVVPIGKPKVMFNAHRIYSWAQVMEYFNSLKLLESALVTDGGEFILDPSPEIRAEQKYGCGCFWFRKE